MSLVQQGRGVVWRSIGSRGEPMLGWCRSCTTGIGSLSVRGPLSSVPLPLPRYSPNSIRGLALADTVSALVVKEAIELAPPPPGFYSRLFVTPKVTSGWRPVIDLSRFNGWVDVSHFHMETTQTVFQSLRMPPFRFRCIHLLTGTRGFAWGESVYQFCALCFSLSTAPQAFTRVMAPVSSIMHRHGFRILRYLDDWLILASSFREIVRARDFLLWLCRQLRIHINLPKSSLDPSQTRDDNLDFSFEGLPNPPKGPEIVLSAPGVPLRPPTSCVGLVSAPRSDVFVVGSCSGVSAAHEVPSASPQRCRASPSRRGSRLLGRLLPAGSSVVD